MKEEIFRGQIYEDVMPQKLDLTDRKIIYLLSKNARFSNTAIAKALKLKREVVAYRIKTMIDNKVINGFQTYINPRKIGQEVHIVFIKLKSPQNEKEMLNFLSNISEITTLSNCSGMYDLYIEITSSTSEEFDNVLGVIISKFKESIYNYNVLTFLKENSLGRGFLLEQEEASKSSLDNFNELKGSCFQKEFESQETSSDVVKVDETDKKILATINHDARATIKEISEKIGVTPLTVDTRLKRLVKTGVIIKFMPIINFAHFNLHWFVVLFYMKDLNEPKFLEYLSREPRALWYVRYVGQWNYQVNIFAEGNSKFHDVLNRLRAEFSENIINFESVILFGQEKCEHLLK